LNQMQFIRNVIWIDSLSYTMKVNDIKNIQAQ
jgi:hypothetical protein